MQSLLADRFRLAVHTETKQVPVYDLEPEKPGKTGPQLQLHSNARPCSAVTDPSALNSAGTTTASSDASALPSCGTMTGHFASGEMQVDARSISMPQVAGYLRSMGSLDRPVLDRTQLSGNFDFTLEWTPQGTISLNGANVQLDENGPSFLEALKEQLGLKLNATTGPIDFLVIDHVEEPSAN
jgi:uncharacterized protein (TIGR03435 family)